MNLKSIRCPKCKKFYNIDGYPNSCCPDCLSLEDDTYQTVREFVKQHPGVAMTTVSKTLNVPESKLRQYLREDKLEIVDKSGGTLRCLVCGKPIISGVYCENHKSKG